MDAAIERAIQAEAAEALLDRGVSIPLRAVKLPWRRRPVELRVTLKRPRLSGQIDFARAYLGLGVTAAEMQTWDKDAQLRFMAKKGKALSRMVALCICRGVVKRRFIGLASWALRSMVEPRMLVAAVQRFVSLLGTDPFMSIIRSAERTNPMKLRLSQGKKGS